MWAPTEQQNRNEPKKASPFRRLHTALRRAYLRWLLADLQHQAKAVDGQLALDAIQAQQLAQMHCISHSLAARRRNGRRHLATLTERIVTVRAELAELQVQP